MMTIFRRVLSVGSLVLAMQAGVACSHAPQPLCERVSGIRSIPMKGQGQDEAYLALMNAGEAAIPCLIDKITDVTPMVDPRMAPTYQGIVVGDVAIIMLVRITEMDFPELLPDEVKEDYRVRGVYAYFDYTAEPANREALQHRWREWWKQHHTNDRSDNS